ncbi:MAG: trehalose-phosphatase [Bacteroidetes bacterium]|nr:trehalose-phosphatase [Bacteroidota bacterium]
MNTHNRLFIITGHLPLQIQDLDARITVQPSFDDRTSTIAAFLQPDHGIDSPAFREIGWTGITACTPATWALLPLEGMPGRISWYPVFLSAKYEQGLIQGFGNTVLWPLFHYLPTDAKYQAASFADYVGINSQFTESMQRYLRPGDTVWIHDYHLLPLAGMLRELLPELTIGLSLHIPFPSFTAFRRLPEDWQRQILKGMLGADLIGFQTAEFADHFRSSVRMILNTPVDGMTVEFEDRLVATGVFTMKSEWGKDFLTALKNARHHQQNFQIRFFDVYSQRQLMEHYRNAGKRQFLLDYDGTLMPFFDLPSQARPADMVLDSLRRLAADDRNSVCIISGRDSNTLQNWLGQLPIHIIAEHGAEIRYRGQPWQRIGHHVDEWKHHVLPAMEHYTGKCPGAFIEEKNFSIVWHYRNADAPLADSIKMDLYSKLSGIIAGLGLQITMGKKIVEVRSGHIDKGSTVQNLLGRETGDFILAIGDDRTDEDMFRALADQKQAFTIKVGHEASYAHFNVHTPQSVISLLDMLGHI